MNSQLRQAQEEAEEVKVIMMKNVEKTEKRELKLQDLDKRAEELKLKSKSFQKTTMKLTGKKKSDKIKAKWKLIVVVAGSAMIIIIIAVIVLVNRSTDERSHERGINPTIGPGK